MAASSHTAGDTLLAWNIFSGVVRFSSTGTYLGQTRLEIATLFEPWANSQRQTDSAFWRLEATTS